MADVVGAADGTIVMVGTNDGTWVGVSLGFVDIDGLCDMDGDMDGTVDTDGFADTLGELLGIILG